MTPDVMTTAKSRVYISCPKKYMNELSKAYKLDHGLLITELNSCLNEGYVRTYFKNLGFYTKCKILKFRNSGNCMSVAYVRFATEDEADQADWTGPHYIGGTEVVSKRIVSPKVEGESEDETEGVSSRRPPLRSVGLCYALEDPQWLEEDKKHDAV